MKKILAIVLSAIMLLSLFACGQPADTTDPTVTDAPETDAPETDAPATDAPETDAPETDAPETDAPETDAPETDAPAAASAPTATADNLLFDLTFDNVDAPFSQLPAGFTVLKGLDSWNLFSGEDGYIQLKSGVESGEQRLQIQDDSCVLLQNRFAVEFQVEFSKFPTAGLSIMAWVTRVSGKQVTPRTQVNQDGFAYSSSLDDGGQYRALELNKKYTFTCVYDMLKAEQSMYIDGVFVDASELADVSASRESSIRIMADNKDAVMKIYGLKAFYCPAE